MAMLTVGIQSDCVGGFVLHWEDVRISVLGLDIPLQVNFKQLYTTSRKAAFSCYTLSDDVM